MKVGLETVSLGARGSGDHYTGPGGLSTQDLEVPREGVKEGLETVTLGECVKEGLETITLGVWRPKHSGPGGPNTQDLEIPRV